MRNNNDIFNRVFQNTRKYGVNFISSNRGTGKTVYFTFQYIRRALEFHEPFHLFCRWSEYKHAEALAFIAKKQSYSERQIRWLEKIEVKKESNNFIFFVNKETNEKIGQIFDIAGQEKYKKIGNIINGHRALMDEVLLANGRYCPQECINLSSLLDTLARSDWYSFCGLYNDISPKFPHFKFWGGKIHGTHVSKTGALFQYFVAEKWSKEEKHFSDNSLQAISQKTIYGDMGDLNEFQQFPNFLIDTDLRGCPFFYSIEINGNIFRIREKDGLIFLDSNHANKENGKDKFSIDEFEETNIPRLPPRQHRILSMYRDCSRLKTNRKENTIFVKILSDYL